MNSDFPEICFRGELRPSQRDVVEIAREQLAAGEKELHIVAPPGSGKTILGLYLWAECVRQPAVVLSPNSAIQAQWADRLDLFHHTRQPHEVVSTDPKQPKLFTSLTYQSITLPQRGNEDLDSEAMEIWIQALIEQQQAKDPDEAEVWIADLKRHNRNYFDERLSRYRKVLRDQTSLAGKSLQTLHHSSRTTLTRLKEANVGLVILDECHHLMGHWGRVLADAHKFFQHPVVIGLTATPPDFRGCQKEDVDRYKSYFGPIDYEVPVPAVVKDGFLAPYQDLVQLTRPTADELEYVANADRNLYAFVDELCTPIEQTESSKKEDVPERESLIDWLFRTLSERSLPVGNFDTWKAFAERDPSLAEAGPIFLKLRGVDLPEQVPEPEIPRPMLLPGESQSKAERIPIDVLIPVLDRYIRHSLRRSQYPDDHQRAENAIARLRMLGTQITETGPRACASPIGRLMAYSRGKIAAIVPILIAEQAALGDRIRAIVVTDFEKTSAVTSEIAHLLDDEAGGAIAAFRMLLSDPRTDVLDPVLVTGSTVLVDDDLAEEFDAAAQNWLKHNRYAVELEFHEEDGFHVVSGSGRDWCPRVYVSMVTELFQRGLTKCLVGTRGLLGEGWDANKVNVLIDLTTVTTSTSVNQLRGRSMRIDPEEQLKLAHNWDVVCVAPEFTKGLDDYARFIKKHDSLFGVTDDGLIEKGVGHVHAAFTEIEPELVEDSMTILNEEMLKRPHHRETFRQLWKIGIPYKSEPIHTVELCPSLPGPLPPSSFGKPVVSWNPHSLTMAIAKCVLGALQQTRRVPQSSQLSVEVRAGNYVRVFLEGAEPDAAQIFTQGLAEAMGPIENARYVIHRHVDYRQSTWLSKIMPEVFRSYFEIKRSELEMVHAIPKVLCKNKSHALIYAEHWNKHVSAGEPVFARSQAGEELISTATEAGQTPITKVHHKEVFE